jgi:hypothetical protein
VLLEGLGWPAGRAHGVQEPNQAAGHAAAGALLGVGQRSDEEELRMQLLTLQVVGAWCPACALRCACETLPRLIVTRESLQNVLTWPADIRGSSQSWLMNKPTA